MTNTDAIQLAMSAIKNLVLLINELRKNSLQNAEMTPEEDAKYDADLEAIFSKANWKVE